MNALIIRPGALGDTLMLLPSLVNIAERVRITFVGRQPGLNFIKDFVTFSMDLDGAGWHRLFLEKPVPKGLPVPQTDVAVAFFTDRDGIIHRNLSGYFPNTPVHVFPSFPADGEKIHVTRYLSNCLRKAGLPIDPQAAFENARKYPLIHVKRPSQSGQNKRRTVVAHPGSGGTEKNHTPELWLRLLDRLIKERVFQRPTPHLLLGPAEENLYSFFKRKLEPTLWKICLCPDKETLTALLAKACVYLGHDSGPTHLAAMLGTPTIALFRSSDALQWHPLGPFVRVIQNKEPGADLIQEVIKASKDLSTAGATRPFVLS